MAEFPYAEYYADLPVDTMSRDAFMQAVTALGPGMLGGVARGFKALRGSGVGRIREAMAIRQAAETARATQTGSELEALLARLGGKMGPSGISQPGAIAEAGGFGRLSRPWPGVQKGTESAGRTVPRSYQSPRTYYLEE